MSTPHNNGPRHRGERRKSDGRFYAVLAVAFLSFVLLMALVDGIVNGAP